MRWGAKFRLIDVSRVVDAARARGDGGGQVAPSRAAATTEPNSREKVSLTQSIALIANDGIYPETPVHNKVDLVGENPRINIADGMFHDRRKQTFVQSNAND
jgi:hypothetical protein